MPELYGNPRKSELRTEISTLRSELAAVRKENMNLRRSLTWMQAAKTELEIKIQRMEGSAKEVLSIAAMDIGDRVSDRIEAERRARFKAAAVEAGVI
jgi:hypothetical protein